MEHFELNATVRKTTGNSPARQLRKAGQVPAVLYGPQTESVLLSVNAKEFEQILKKGNLGSIILNLIIQNGKKITKPAMIKEFQSHHFDLPIDANHPDAVVANGALAREFRRTPRNPKMCSGPSARDRTRGARTTGS